MTDTPTVDMSPFFGEMLRRDRQNRAPDVLNTIASLSSDEIFTPPDFANRMLDTLADTWAADHGGAPIWADPNVTFLDPATKSGVFLREITKRLVEGQGNPPEGSQERMTLVDRVLTRQVFGIGMTTLTSLLARRSIYCSKDATNEHSVAPSSTSPHGNIWFERTEHIWKKGTPVRTVDPITTDEVLTYPSCSVCGAARRVTVDGVVRRFDDPDLETHAYALLHADDPKQLVNNLYGDDMHFDVIIGNPPYQMTGAAGGSSDASIYHLFVEQAIRLEPRYLSMVTPSRWLAGGRGMDTFRSEMLGGGHLRALVDFPASAEAFTGVEIKGGVSYFLWDGGYEGECNVTMIRGNELSTSLRDLGEFDVFVRDSRAVEILHKVRAVGESSINTIMARDTPFGLASNFADFRAAPLKGDIPLYFIRTMKRGIGYLKPKSITKNAHFIATWKLLVPEAFNGGDAVPHQIVGKPLVAPSPSVCTQSFLFMQVGSEAEAQSAQSYYATKFFRFLVSLRKITQHALNSTYTWVPLQTWDRTWADADLYAKYQLTLDEIAYIESVIKPMELASAGSEE